MENCLAPLVFGAIIIVVFGFWLHSQGEAVFQKAITQAEVNAWAVELNAFVENWEKETGQKFAHQSLYQQKIVLGEWVLNMIEVHHVKPFH